MSDGWQVFQEVFVIATVKVRCCGRHVPARAQRINCLSTIFAVSNRRKIVVHVDKE